MNPVIEISKTAELDQQLNLPNRVIFLVLGETPAHQEVLDLAAGMSADWRFTVSAKDPASLYDRLHSLNLRPGVLKIASPWPSEILAVSISISNSICRCVTDTEENSVAGAFMLAETYLQP
jgi:hypothetical protein